jgi:subtilisin family serine protease
MYTYTYGGKAGKKSTLAESPDRVVVRTKNARKLGDAVYSEEGRQVLEDFIAELEFSEADVTVLKAKEIRPRDFTLRDNARSVLKKEPELRFAGRVLADPVTQVPVVYTENLFIKFLDSVPVETCERILLENNLEIKQKSDLAPNAYFAGTPENTGLQVFELAEALLGMAEVEYCHPELIRKMGRKSINSRQWHLQPATINGRPVNANMKANLAHQLSLGSGILIAVIDDGVDIDNPEFNLPGKVVASRDIAANSNDPRPRNPDDRHGTACAGVAAAAGINASGVAPAATLMPIRLNPNLGLGSMAEANAFKWAADHGADIISCSWGPADGYWDYPADPGHTTRVDLPDSTRLAIDYAIANGRNGKGCVIAFAAGNGNEDIKYDGYASYPKVMAVAACNDTGRRSVYSDYGDAVWCAFPSNDFGHAPYSHPAPITPGIYTTDRKGQAGYNPYGDYCDDFGGTSSACPGAAGTAALILSANPDLTWQQVKEIIRETAEKIDPANGQYNAAGHSRLYGYGRVDAEKAVKRAMELKSSLPPVRVKIISALVDPAGSDRNKEEVTIRNLSQAPVDLSGWNLQVGARRQALDGILAAGETRIVRLVSTMVKLPNTGATIVLMNNMPGAEHSVTYEKKQVKKGVEISFPEA